MPKATVVTIPAQDAAKSGILYYQEKKNYQTTIWYRIYLCLAPAFYRESWLVNILAFLLGRVSLTGELAPFGFAFFAAVAKVSGKHALGVGFFAVLGLLSVGRYFDAGLYILAIILYLMLTGKMVATGRMWHKSPPYIFFVVAMSAIPMQLWRQATFYNMLLALFDALICMVLTYIFLSGVKILLKEPAVKRVPNESLLCLIIILSVAVAGLDSLMIAGYSLRNIAAGFIVMFLAMTGGTIGSAVGIMVGLAVGLSNSNATTVISLYAISGLLAGTFRSLGKIGVIVGFVLGSVIASLHFDQGLHLVNIVSESLIASAFFAVVPVRLIKKWDSNFEDKGKERSETGRIIMNMVNKLGNVAQIFDNLAAASGQLICATNSQSRQAEVNGLLAAIGHEVCGPCQGRKKCWEKDYYLTYQAVVEAMAYAEQTELTIDGLPGVLNNNCLYARQLVVTVNKVAKNNLRYTSQQKKAITARKVLAEQYKSISDIISALTETLQQELTLDEDLSVKLLKKADYVNCQLEEVRVGKDKGMTVVDIVKFPCEGTSECLHTISPLLSRILKQKFTLDAKCGQNCVDGKCHLTLKATGNYGVRAAIASKAKEKGICGDTCAVITVTEAKTALVVSDGMGSGTRAADESAMVVEYLTKLLVAGFETDVAIKTVNDLLLLRRTEESFATLDIATVDMSSCEGEFFKVGAAPSYIKRVHEVITIKSAAPPIGILEQVEIEPVKCLLAPGDIIVMVSDGIIDIPSSNSAKEPWLVNFLRRMQKNTPQEMADEILRQALYLSGAVLHDDLTVMVAQVVEKAD